MCIHILKIMIRNWFLYTKNMIKDKLFKNTQFLKISLSFSSFDWALAVITFEGSDLHTPSKLWGLGGLCLTDKLCNFQEKQSNIYSHLTPWLASYAEPGACIWTDTNILSLFMCATLPVWKCALLSYLNFTSLYDGRLFSVNVWNNYKYFFSRFLMLYLY